MNDAHDLSARDYTQNAHESDSTVPVHPLGVKPLGNAYAAQVNLKKNLGYFATLPDELIVRVLEYLEQDALTQLGRVCKAFFAFSQLDELWKNICIASGPPLKKWRGTWRESCVALNTGNAPVVDCTGLFSDVLYRPFYCAHTPLHQYFSAIPSQNAIPRMPDLSLSEFALTWADEPFILTKPVKEWPVFGSWTGDGLGKAYGDTTFRAEAVEWLLSLYVQYMQNNNDESPLYLFDQSFAEKMHLELDDNRPVYTVPECFQQDLFTVLGKERPDHRWLIIGPARSGSTFHKDPNATSAWNAVVQGSKYWIMFPSRGSTSSDRHVPAPPGVFVSEDESEVTSPLSIAEWLINFHAEARRTPGCKEGVCFAGEVLHVPSGWWHLVVNLEESIAITQNFVPEAHLVDVLAFLKDKPEQVSGFARDVDSAFELFVERMRVQHPEMIEQGLAELKRSSKQHITTKRKRRWEQITETAPHALPNGNDDATIQSEKTERSGFQFGFGAGDSEHDDVP